MLLLGETEIEDLALGAAILGTGGGGNPYIGKRLALRAVARFGPVRLVMADELPPDALVVPTGMMGAPTIIVEKLPRGDEAYRAFEALQEFLGRPITHAMAMEAGGINSTIPIAVAAKAGVPLVDADLMGRAFPELQMCTPNLYGISACPMTIVDEKNNAATLEASDNVWTERLARSLTVDMGAAAFITLYPMTGQQVKQSTIRGTLTLCTELGRLVRETRHDHGDVIGAVTRRLRGFRIFDGKITDVRRRTEAGFARAETVLEGVGDSTGSSLRIQSQNEHLVAMHDGDIVATVPDLIIVLDSETAEPIATEEMRYGQRATVVVAPGDPHWRSPEGLGIVGPHYFGYEIDFVPVEQRFGAVAAAR